MLWLLGLVVGFGLEELVRGNSKEVMVGMIDSLWVLECWWKEYLVVDTHKMEGCCCLAMELEVVTHKEAKKMGS